MSITAILMNYVIPVVAGVFVLIFISIFVYIIHKAVLKPVGFYRFFKNIRLAMKRKKLLADEKLIEYCVTRINLNWKEPKVREELLLANKYSKKKIDDIIYTFNIINTEMKGNVSKVKQASEDLP